MASAQEMLAAAGSVQQDAQASLPVIPNNGNPGGAYNMPQTTQEPAKPAGPDLSWLQPSKYMEQVSSTIAEIQNNIDKKTAGEFLQQASGGATAQTPSMPVMPQESNSMSGVVLPQMG